MGQVNVFFHAMLKGEGLPVPRHEAARVRGRQGKTPAGREVMQAEADFHLGLGGHRP